MATEEHHMSNFTMTELEEALKGLILKKSPGKNEITNEMLTKKGQKDKRQLLVILNTSWKTGQQPSVWN